MFMYHSRFSPLELEKKVVVEVEELGTEGGGGGCLGVERVK